MLNLSTVLSDLTRFESLNLNALYPLDERYVSSIFLHEPYVTAIFHFFGGGLEFEDMLTAFHLKQLSKGNDVSALQIEVQEAIRFVLLQIEVAHQESDSTESTDATDALDTLKLGEFFLDLVWERKFSKATPYSFALTSGRTIGEVELICALMMIQVGQVANYVQAQDAVAACTLMWDIHRLDAELALIVGEREVSDEARERSKDLNQIRHRKRHEAKALVCAEWERNPSAHPSAEKAGRHFSEWLESKGIRFEPRTVTRWICQHAKAIGVKFR